MQLAIINFKKDFAYWVIARTKNVKKVQGEQF